VKRLYPEQPLVGIGAVIVSEGKILLEKRGNEPGRGQWSIPGGLVELGESTEQTLVREVREETGLEVESAELIDVVGNAVRDEAGKIEYHFVIIDYLTKIKGGTLKAGTDAEELKWVELAEVEKCDLTKTFREFFTRNKRKLREAATNSSS
jgi:mutator protein MutT